MASGLRWTEEEYAAYIAQRAARVLPQPARAKHDGRRNPAVMPKYPDPPDRFLELIRHAKLPPPACEVLFISGRDFRADYLWLAPRVIVEMQGYKDHSTKKGLHRDYEKLNLAQAAGWRVFQFTPKQLASVEAIEFLRPFLKGSDESIR